MRHQGNRRLIAHRGYIKPVDSYRRRFKTAGRLLVHWGLGVTAGGAIGQSLTALGLGIILLVAGQLLTILSTYRFEA